MTVYAWPAGADWRPRTFELRIIPNLRSFTGPYVPTTQVLDLLGERWAARLDMVGTNSPVVAAAREAFFDRLKGMAHQISLWHQRLIVPQGTLRGSPTVASTVAQLANTASVQTTAGATVLAGDMLGLGAQLVRVMADATADGAGVLAIEFQPRARAAIAGGTAVTWLRPAANFMLRAPDGVPTVWAPGFADGASIELIEVI